MQDLIWKAKEQLGGAITALEKLSSGFNKKIGDRLKLAEKEHGMLELEIAGVRGDIEKLQETKKSLHADIAKTQKKIEGLYEDYEKSIADKTAKLHEWGGNLAGKEKELRKTHDDMHSLAQIVNADKGAIDKKKEKVIALEKDLKEQLIKYKALQEDEVEAKNNLSRDRKIVDKMLAEYKTKTRDCRELEQAWVQKNNKLMSESERLKKAQADITKQEKSLKKEETRLLHRADELAQEEKSIEKEREKNRVDRVNLQAKDDNLKILEKELRAKYAKK